MVSTSLRQFLQSLCCDSPWDYAVFWRLQQHQSEMLLTWEDGLFDVSRPREPLEGMLDTFYFNQLYEGLSSSCQLSTQDENLGDSLVGALVAEMSKICYVVGKGLVGEAAYTEIPSWIYTDNLTACGSGFSLISECPDELLHQFVVGIKTILLLPLVPEGVLQLGSMDVVAEDAELVTCVKNKFDADQQFAGYFSPFRSDRKFLIQPPEQMFTYRENLGELSGNAMDKTDRDFKILSRFGVESDKKAIANQVISMVQDLNHTSQKSVPKVIDCDSENKISIEPVDLVDITELFKSPICGNIQPETTQNILRSSFLDEELDAYTFFNDYDMTHYRSPVNQIRESYSNEGVMIPAFAVEDSNRASCQGGGEIFRFPGHGELHKALGSILPDHADPDFVVSADSYENATRSSVCNEDIIHGNQPIAWYAGRQFAQENKVESLLEDVVANANSISDDSSSNRLQSPTSLEISSRKFGSSQMELSALAGEDKVPLSCVTSAFSGDRDSPRKVSPSTSSFDCVISALIEQQLQRDGKCSMHPTKSSKLTSANKRRARPGDNQKPRPRDRQLIQDRIKELRDLVPNGTKCSIDGLLSRTIKHMQFLRSVTNQADKVQQHVLKEASYQKDFKSPTVKGSNGNGTSWAMELDNEKQTCPIIVKDLEHAGHMLIEMLCNDHGRFLEIADVIHRLELTILKGVMERRSDECTWAHFIVEASGSFHRLDIFWPLMQLLQQNRSQISSKI